MTEDELKELERLAEDSDRPPASWSLGRTMTEADGYDFAGKTEVGDVSTVKALIAALRAERARADRLAKLLGEARDSLGAWGAVIRIRGESSLEIDQQVADIDAALSGLAEKR